MKWISKLLGRAERELMCVQTLTKDDLRLTVSEYRRGCGHPGFLIEMFVYFPPKDRWLPIGILHQADVHNALALLMEGATFIDRTLSERFQVELLDD